MQSHQMGPGQVCEVVKVAGVHRQSPQLVLRRLACVSRRFDLRLQASGELGSNVRRFCFGTTPASGCPTCSTGMSARWAWLDEQRQHHVRLPCELCGWAAPLMSLPVACSDQLPAPGERPCASLRPGKPSPTPSAFGTSCSCGFTCCRAAAKAGFWSPVGALGCWHQLQLALACCAAEHHSTVPHLHSSIGERLDWMMVCH